MYGLALLCGLLFAAVCILSVKVCLMRRAADEIRTGLAEKLAADTNTLLRISSRDRAMRRLTADLNRQLRELRSQRQRFTQGDLELKKAVTGISHDLRTPLTAISGYIDLLEQEDKSPAASRYVEVIKSRAEVLRELTEEFFRYSVLTSPDAASPTERVSVREVLEESLLGFYAALLERGISPQLCLPEDRVMRMVNRAALSRIFSNLLHNALKYSDGDLSVTLDPSGRVSFCNSASSLDEMQVERLFDRYYTVESGQKSTGLGLSIARMLAQQMNGTLSARYANGKLKIVFSLPADSCTAIGDVVE